MDFALTPRQVAYARLGYAAAALFTPKVATAALGAKPGQMTPAAMGWAGVFATREAALAALSMGSEGESPAVRRKVLLLNAAVDAVDTAVLLLLMKRQRSILPLFVAVPAGVMSAVAHVQAAKRLQGIPPGTGNPVESAYAAA